MALLAHVGSPVDGLWAGVIHPLTGIDHLLAMVAVGILAAVADRRIAWASPAAFVGGMVIGGALGVAGVGSTLIETTIAVSVVALGGLIAITPRSSTRLRSALPLLALSFGAIHGIAHGGEVPTSASPSAYVAGFVLATVALHLGSVTIGSTVGRHAVVRAALAGAISVTGVALLAVA